MDVFAYLGTLQLTIAEKRKTEPKEEFGARLGSGQHPGLTAIAIPEQGQLALVATWTWDFNHLIKLSIYKLNEKLHIPQFMQLRKVNRPRSALKIKSSLFVTGPNT